MEYNFRDIEQKWKKYWNEQQVYKVQNDPARPKFYILDMFPYPSGAGLHVGHPLGYIASDIYARYKRLRGYNVLHPMGFDAFGLPAEQYALETGQHPAVTTENNIARYKEQLDNIGFCYDWTREFRTSDPSYYKWTQWIFLQLFKSWYDRGLRAARPIDELVALFEKEGNRHHPCPGDESLSFDSKAWNAFTEKEKHDILMQYRLAYCGFGEVNWCEGLGTVLANDEVVNGVSERGGFPVVKKKLRQWYLRITEYAGRLLDSLENLEWTEAMKEMQRNWIGKSQGAEVRFHLLPASSGGGGDIAQDTPGWNTADPALYGGIKDFRNDLKRNQTEAEAILWQALRNSQLGDKFRRQHIIGRYIADFVCLSKRLIIEVDGKIHDRQIEKDEARSTYLNERGFTVIRFRNEEIIADIDTVCEKIKRQLEVQSHNTTLSFGEGQGEVFIDVFTTRPDTIFGVDFMVLAPEHELVDQVTTAAQKATVEKYKEYVQSRSERERMSEVKQVTGAFTGAYVIHPFTGKQVPVWISEYVLAGYGTGAIMAVPSGDDRDFAFARHFEIPVTNIFGDRFTGEAAYSEKTGTLINSDFLTGLEISKATDAAIRAIEDAGIGKRRINYRLRDAAFSRQRYWGEPFPIQWKEGMAIPLSEDQLPLVLPQVDKYTPGPEGEGPLANLPEWSEQHLETNTMPGYAGSSWYFLRYADPHNDTVFADRAATDYWNQVDVYVGGTEHAVGHLLYSRMWTKALHDLGYISFDEPFKKLVNQGMIQGNSRFVYRVQGENKFVSSGLKDQYKTDEIHVDVNIVDGLELDIDAFRKWRPEYVDAELILEDGKYICGVEIEKMSKRWFNVVNPDDIVNRFGADTFRMYEMFLGPLEQSKPWDTKGIEGVHRFLKKLWRLYADEQKGWIVEETAPTDAELRIIHKTIKKIGEDIERFSFNTCISQFMICVNELTAANCHKRDILEALAVLMAPFAPHIAEELWKNCFRHESSVTQAIFPKYEEQYVTDNSKVYPVAVNGKTRTEMEFPLDIDQASLEKEVLADEQVIKWLEGKTPKKVIYVKGRMINVVV